MKKKNYLTSKRKTEIVLQLLRGEDMEMLSRKYEVTMSDISQWRDIFLSNGENGFKRSPENSKLHKAERLIGQLQMELELTKKKNELIKKRKRS
jgi:transposase